MPAQSKYSSFLRSGSARASLSCSARQRPRTSHVTRIDFVLSRHRTSGRPTHLLLSDAGYLQVFTANHMILINPSTCGAHPLAFGPIPHMSVGL